MRKLLYSLLLCGCATAPHYTPSSNAGNSCKNQCDLTWETCRRGVSCSRDQGDCYKSCAEFNGGSYATAGSLMFPAKHGTVETKN